MLLNSSPFFVALLARFTLGEAITRLRAAGLVIGFGGVLLAVFSDPDNIAHGSQLAIGFVLALLGALGWAGGGIGMKVLTRRQPDLDIPGITAAQFLAGAVPLIPLVLLAGGTTDWGRPSLDLQLAYLNRRRADTGLPRVQRRAEPLAVNSRVSLDVPGARGRGGDRSLLGRTAGFGATIGVALVILGVGIVNHPRAEHAVIETNDQPPMREGVLLGDSEPTI